MLWSPEHQYNHDSFQRTQAAPFSDGRRGTKMQWQGKAGRAQGDETESYAKAVTFFHFPVIVQSNRLFIMKIIRYLCV